MAEVTLENVTKEFGRETAVDDVDLSVEDGEILGVVGPSGCGKTTTLRTIAGFETPTEGRVLFDGDDVTHVPPEQRNVGLVFQSYALFNNMTVLENVAFGLKMEGVETSERRERARDLLDLLDISDIEDRSPDTLSGGQQQRVGLARALAIEPGILLLDEPMTGLDAKLKHRLQREIGSLLDDLGVTALYVTHDQEEAMVMCDRIAVMNDGEIEQVGTAREIYETPANDFVADFVGSANLFDGVLEDGMLDLGFGDLEIEDPPLLEGKVRVLVRPQDITVGEGGVEVDIQELYYVGEEIQAVGTLPDGQELTFVLDSSTQHLSTGDTVNIDMDGDRIHVIESGHEDSSSVDE
ncbi:MAG: ABC transporter ATP-binding protein [Halodesulfurarchaeum sp.]